MDLRTDCAYYGANGITFAVIAAGILRDDYLGHAHPDALLFSFERTTRR